MTAIQLEKFLGMIESKLQKLKILNDKKLKIKNNKNKKNFLI